MGSPTELLIITGMSGAGRSTAAKALEDLGWYVVDNLPPQLIGELADLTSGAEPAVHRIAVAVDVRGRSFFSELSQAIENASKAGLNAFSEVLMQEYPVERRSIAIRERIVLPLVIIQHFALQRINENKNPDLNEIYNKLVIRTVYGIVNAGRNLA